MSQMTYTPFLVSVSFDVWTLGRISVDRLRNNGRGFVNKICLCAARISYKTKKIHCACDWYLLCFISIKIIVISP